MESFGNFETIREIHRTGFGAVYSAHSKENATEKYAVKVFQPPELFSEQSQTQQQSKRFIDSARIQQQLSADKTPHWAPIHHIDSTLDGAFYVTDLYDRSLQQIIDGHVRLTSQALAEIINSIVMGLIELDQACSRPHGNLKATNILISGHGRNTTIVLSDPLPSQEIKEHHRAEDLQKIAELIFQLVMHRQAPASPGWQVSKSDNWSHLDKSAGKWKQLCNELARAGIDPQPIELEDLANQLAQLNVRKKSPIPYVIIVVLTTMIIAALAWYFFKPPSISMAQSDWNKLCTEYIAWIQHLKFDDALLNEKPELSPQLELAKHPNELLKCGNKADVDDLMHMSFKELAEYCSSGKKPSEYCKQCTKEKKIITKTAAALEAVQKIKNFLTPPSDENRIGWQLLADTNTVAGILENDPKLAGLSDTLHELVSAVKPPDNFPQDEKITQNETIADNIKKLLEHKDQVAAILEHNEKIKTAIKTIQKSQNSAFNKIENYINGALLAKESTSTLAEISQSYATISENAGNIATCIQTIDSNKKIMDDSGIEFLKKYDNYIQAEVEKHTNLEKLSEQLESTKTQTKKLADFITKSWRTEKVDRVLFLSYRRDQDKQSGTPTKDSFKEWIDQARKYLKIPYGTYESGLDELKKTIPEINKKVAALKKLKRADLAGPIQEKLQRLKKKVLEIDGDKISEIVIEGEKTPLIEKNREKIAKYFKELQQETNNLLTNAQRKWFEVSTKPEDWWPAIKNNKGSAVSKAINKEWRLRRNDVLNNKKLEDYTGENNLDKFLVLKEKIEKIETSLQDMDRKLSSQLNGGLPDRDWIIKLSKLYGGERELLCLKIIVWMQLPNVVPDPDSDKFKNQWEVELNKLNGRYEKLHDLAVDFSKLEKALNIYCRIDDNFPWDPDSKKTIRSLYNKWSDKDVTEEAEVSDILSAINQRVEDLIAADISEDRDKLMSLIHKSLVSEELNTLHTAWKKIGSISDPSWPYLPDDLELDSNTFNKLNAVYTGIDAKYKTHRDMLLKDIVKTAIDHKVIAINHKVTSIEKESRGDPILGKFKAVVKKEINQADLTRLDDIKKVADNIIEFITKDPWQSQSNKINLSRLLRSEDYKQLSEIDIEGYNRWILVVKDYRILEIDPRENFGFKNKLNDIKELINKVPDDTKDELVTEFTSQYNEYKDEFDNIMELPAIEKHFKEISARTPDCENLLKDLNDLEKEVRDTIKPEFCKRLDLENGKIVFAVDTYMKAFEPVREQNDTFININSWDEIKDDKNNTYFVETTDPKNQNYGWPKYIRSTKDDSVILRLVPEDNDKNIPPFYIAIRETDNQQYIKFLNLQNILSSKKEKEDVMNNPESLWFKTDSGTKGIMIYFSPERILINSKKDARAFNLPCGIERGKQEKEYKLRKRISYWQESKNNDPITWVTPYGADFYARWLKADLPTVTQHKYAATAGTGKIPIPKFSHVRREKWKKVANKRLEFKKLSSSEKGEPPPSPFGAVEGDYNTDIVNVTYNEYDNIWPTGQLQSKNDWDLYDMIGNVWEWCKADSGNKYYLCGGSCLSPPPDSFPKYAHTKNGKGCDVGFRVVVNIPQALDATVSH